MNILFPLLLLRFWSWPPDLEGLLVMPESHAIQFSVSIITTRQRKRVEWYNIQYNTAMRPYSSLRRTSFEKLEKHCCKTKTRRENKMDVVLGKSRESADPLTRMHPGPGAPTAVWPTCEGQRQTGSTIDPPPISPSSPGQSVYWRGINGS